MKSCQYKCIPILVISINHSMYSMRNLTSDVNLFATLIINQIPFNLSRNSPVRDVFKRPNIYADTQDKYSYLWMVSVSRFDLLIIKVGQEERHLRSRYLMYQSKFQMLDAIMYDMYRLWLMSGECPLNVSWTNCNFGIWMFFTIDIIPMANR